MFADKRAAGVGDILTIVVQEISSANKNNETKTEKNSSWTAAITSFLFPGFAAIQRHHAGRAVQFRPEA